MKFVVGAPLFACLFDQASREYVAMRIGTVVKVTDQHVECGGVAFKVAARMVYPTLAGAEERAAALNRNPG
jgi:hypothetical protein